MALLVLGDVAIARSESVSLLVELPPAYLPGNPLPPNIQCEVPTDRHILCELAHPIASSDQKIYIVFNVPARIIWRTFLQTQAYTLGQLVAAWGTPTGITQTDFNTIVHWGTRSAWLFSTSLQPESKIDYIPYDLEPPSASPWRGFMRVKR